MADLVRDAPMRDPGPISWMLARLEEDDFVDIKLSFHPFPRLPFELRLDIIEEWLRSEAPIYRTLENPILVRDTLTFRDFTPRYGKLAEYATINKQWKSAIEKHTFHSLSFIIRQFGRNNLPPSRYPLSFDRPNALDDLGRICIGDRINALSKLQLSINLYNDHDPIFCYHSTGSTGSNWETYFTAHRRKTERLGHTEKSKVRTHLRNLAREAFEKVLRVLERLQESKLKSLHLESGREGLRLADPMSTTHPSPHLSQSLFAVTCRLEELTLHHVVDVPNFLSLAANEGNTPQGRPAWPNMRILTVKERPSIEIQAYTRTADDLYGSVTQALPQLPKLTRLVVAIQLQVSADEEWQRVWETVGVYLEISPRNDHSAMRDGLLSLKGPEPDPETINMWQQMARMQWDCKLQISKPAAVPPQRTAVKFPTYMFGRPRDLDRWDL